MKNNRKMKVKLTVCICLISSILSTMIAGCGKRSSSNSPFINSNTSAYQDEESEYEYEDENIDESVTDVNEPKIVSFDIDSNGGEALTEDGALYVWGSASGGNLGTDSGRDVAVPEKLLENVKYYYRHNHLFAYAAILTDGSLYTWGSNMYHHSFFPTKIMDNVASFDFGTDITSFITEDGDLYIWGENDDGTVGDGTRKAVAEPKKIMENIDSVYSGLAYTLAVSKDGELFSWGRNSHGQLGDGTTDDRFTPMKILDDVVYVNMNSRIVTAITKDGSLYVWGENNYGIKGSGTKEPYLTPQKILDNVKWADSHLAITNNGDLYSFDMTEDDSPANGYIYYCLDLKKIAENVSEAGIDEYTKYYVTEDGELYAWGNNSNGTLGTGELTEEVSEPTKILDDVEYVRFYAYSGTAITEYGDLYVWGNNNSGRLGDGTSSTLTSPTLIKDNVAAVELFAEGDGGVMDESALLTRDGELYTWGSHDWGVMLGSAGVIVRTPIKLSFPE